MIQKIIKVGTSAAVVIPKPSLAKLGLKLGDSVVVNTKENGLFIQRENRTATPDEHIAKLTMNFIERYRKDLLSLADK